MAPARIDEDDFDIAIKQVPVTEERLPFIPSNEREQALKHPGTARANEAASVEAPNGTVQDGYARRNRDKTVLQQHCAFFDRDADGVIWPRDTYVGFRALGYGLFITLLSVLVIHVNFSYPTLPPGRYLPDPLFRLHLARIHKDKHGSDSGSYDTEGRFVPQKFEDIFAKYAGGDKQGITWPEVMRYMKGQRLVMDLFGWGGAVFEWLATYLLLWPEDGRMMKDDIRRIYDGSLFYEIAARRKEKKEL